MSSDQIVHATLLTAPASIKQKPSLALSRRRFYQLISRKPSSPLTDTYPRDDLTDARFEPELDKDLDDFLRYLTAVNALYQRQALLAGLRGPKRYGMSSKQRPNCAGHSYSLHMAQCNYRSSGDQYS